ncbi:MAG: addiction module protein [Planctomycetes bacterium]|nr:addiction module protein [Planctomycetota bacterium]
MRIAEVPEIARLTVPEKILFLEELWESIREDESQIPVPPSHLVELDRRLAQHRGSPGELLTLEQFKARISAAR